MIFMNPLVQGGSGPSGPSVRGGPNSRFNMKRDEKTKLATGRQPGTFSETLINLYKPYKTLYKPIKPYKKKRSKPI